MRRVLITDVTQSFPGMNFGSLVEQLSACQHWTPDCASPLLLQANLRDKWGFDGYVVSDCGGKYSVLPKAVQQGMITEARIDVYIKRLFTGRMKLGLTAAWRTSFPER